MGYSSKNSYPGPHQKAQFFDQIFFDQIQISIKLLDNIIFNLHSNYIPCKGGDEIFQLVHRSCNQPEIHFNGGKKLL